MNRRKDSGPAAEETHRPSERGSGTMLSLGLGLVLVIAVLLVVLLGQAASLASRAAAAADLSALAAADAARGLRDGDPCTVAAEIASRDGAQLDSCELQGPSRDVAEIRTSVGSVFGVGRGEGRARAGPPPEDGGGPAPAHADGHGLVGLCGPRSLGGPGYAGASCTKTPTPRRRASSGRSSHGRP